MGHGPNRTDRQRSNRSFRGVKTGRPGSKNRFRRYSRRRFSARAEFRRRHGEIVSATYRLIPLNQIRLSGSGVRQGEISVFLMEDLVVDIRPELLEKTR